MSTTARIQLNVFDGTREPVDPDLDLLVTLRDGNQTQVHRDTHNGPTINFDVPFFNNFGDNYTSIVFADKHVQAGFAPVKVSQTLPRVVDLMLMPKKNKFNFDEASWAKLKKKNPKLSAILTHGATGEPTPRPGTKSLWISILGRSLHS